MKHLLSVLAITLLVNTAVRADDGYTWGIFQAPAVFGGLGAAKTHLDDDGYFHDVFADLGAGRPGVDNNAHTGHVFGGYRFNKFLAAQIDVRDLGSYEAKSATSKYTQDFGALTLSAVGFLPLGNYVSLYGQAGIGSVGVHEKISVPGFRASGDDGAGTGTLGAGVELRPFGLDKLAVRLSWQSYFFTARYDRYYISNPGGNVHVYLRDENNYDQRIDTFGLDLAWYFSL